MKKVYLILSIVLLLGLALVAFIGCGGGGGVTTAADETEACMVCHAGDSSTSEQVLAAGAQYENSGHYLGPRTYANSDVQAATDHLYVHHGSNAMYSNATFFGNTCQKCHTHQGFVDYAQDLDIDNAVVENASQPGCFTCHDPHTNGDFGLRLASPVTLIDTSTFNAGKGNLCATCHLSTGAESSWEGETYPFEIASYVGSHHGPQADFIMGANHWAYGANTYAGASSHVTDTVDNPNSCVGCHMFDPAGRLEGTLGLTGHALYLRGDVHGSDVELTEFCATCHTTAGEFDTNDFTDSDGSGGGGLAAADWDGDSTVEHDLVEIQGMLDTLISYFGDGTNNFGGDGNGPIVDAITGLDYTTPGGKWMQDWEVSTATIPTLVEAQSLWNLKFFIEDKSNGVHNPQFAAQILYDAIDNLNDNAAAGLTLGATRP
jgi:hypothetical protein